MDRLQKCYPNKKYTINGSIKIPPSKDCTRKVTFPFNTVYSCVDYYLLEKNYLNVEFFNFSVIICPHSGTCSIHTHFFTYLNKVNCLIAVLYQNKYNLTQPSLFCDETKSHPIIYFSNSSSFYLIISVDCHTQT